jgi:hypothetical protein
MANLATDVAAGKANTCVCGASAVFTIGFSLLAVLAALWK